MQIIAAKPPNFSEIVAAIPHVAEARRVIFTYGPVIYNPSATPISDELIAHETVHSGRQGADPEGWWRRYLAENVFRLSEEIVAHAAEYDAYCQRVKDRNLRTTALHRMALRLSSPMYGDLISYPDARNEILVA